MVRTLLFSLAALSLSLSAFAGETPAERFLEKLRFEAQTSDVKTFKRAVATVTNRRHRKHLVRAFEESAAQVAEPVMFDWAARRIVLGKAAESYPPSVGEYSFRVSGVEPPHTERVASHTSREICDGYDGTYTVDDCICLYELTSGPVYVVEVTSERKSGGEPWRTTLRYGVDADTLRADEIYPDETE